MLLPAHSFVIGPTVINIHTAPVIIQRPGACVCILRIRMLLATTCKRVTDQRNEAQSSTALLRPVCPLV